MRVLAITPCVDPSPLLPGAQFIDAYCINFSGSAIDARTAANRMFAQSPRWVTRLMSIRNGVMRPLKVKTPSPKPATRSPGTIGIFPIVSETPERLFLGFDDRHLDFRVVVDTADKAGTCTVTVTTIVRTNNILGRLYLTVIMPFHRAIVKSMLWQAITPIQSVARGNN